MSDNLEDNLMQTKEGVWVLKDDTHLSKWIAEHGRLDIAIGEIVAFMKHIPPGGFVVDAGASLGDHTMTYARIVGERGKVFAFEPRPDTCAALGRNMQQFPWVEVRRKALGGYNGPARMRLEPNCGASHITNRHGNEDVEITVRKLDRYLDLMHRLDFIHLDAEGYEVQILNGATEVLRKFKPVIVLEVNHLCLSRLGLVEQDVRDTLAKHGYTWSELEAQNGPNLPQRDILCLKK